MRGEVGELVCRRPCPGMTRGFWGDPERYLETYWRGCPGSGCTATGPRSTRTATGSCTAAPTTRSTSPASGSGRRSSSRRVVAHPAVAEAAAVGVPHEVKGEVAWIFCALVPGAEPSDELAARAARARGRGARQGVHAGAHPVRRGAAEDAQREDRPSRRAREGARGRPGRPVVAREPRDPGGDRACRSQLTASTARSRSSRAAGAGSARGSRASSPTPAPASPSPRARATRSSRSRTRSAGCALELDVTDREAVERMVARDRARARPDRPARRERRHRQRRGRARVGGRPGRLVATFEVNVLGVYPLLPRGDPRDARARRAAAS